MHSLTKLADNIVGLIVEYFSSRVFVLVLHCYPLCEMPPLSHTLRFFYPFSPLVTSQVDIIISDFCLVVEDIKDLLFDYTRARTLFVSAIYKAGVFDLSMETIFWPQNTKVLQATSDVDSVSLVILLNIRRCLVDFSIIHLLC